MSIARAAEEKIDRLLCSLMSREYIKDGSRLNRILATSGSSPEFKEVPPMPYSGDPFSLTPGQCIALIGINPTFNEKHSEAEYKCMQHCSDLFRRGDESALKEFKSLRASYFSSNSKIYDGRYFTRIGNILRQVWFNDGADAKDVFKRYVFKSDCLPWLSSRSRGIDFARVADCNDEAIDLHQELLKAFLGALKPRWIQVNGLQQKEFVEFYFKTKLDSLPSVGMSAKAGWTKSFDIACPIFVHEFLGAQRKARLIEAFTPAADAFRKFVETSEMNSGRFSFS